LGPIWRVYNYILEIPDNMQPLPKKCNPDGQTSSLFTIINDGLKIPFAATYGFVDVFILIIAGLVLIARMAKKIKHNSGVSRL